MPLVQRRPTLEGKAKVIIGDEAVSLTIEYIKGNISMFEFCEALDLASGGYPTMVRVLRHLYQKGNIDF